MKIYLGLVFVVALFIFGANANAQTIKTDEARKLKEVEREIVVVGVEIESIERNISQLLVRYSSDYPEIIKEKAQVENLNKTLTRLAIEKKNLLTKQLIKSLPSNDIELLKLIVLQNERIIDLLERLVKIR